MLLRSGFVRLGESPGPNLIASVKPDGALSAIDGIGCLMDMLVVTSPTLGIGAGPRNIWFVIDLSISHPRLALQQLQQLSLARLILTSLAKMAVLYRVTAWATLSLSKFLA
jgi:hypothetical protein